MDWGFYEINLERSSFIEFCAMALFWLGVVRSNESKHAFLKGCGLG